MAQQQTQQVHRRAQASAQASKNYLVQMLEFTLNLLIEGVSALFGVVVGATQIFSGVIDKKAPELKRKGEEYASKAKSTAKNANVQANSTMNGLSENAKQLGQDAKQAGNEAQGKAKQTADNAKRQAQQANGSMRS